MTTFLDWRYWLPLAMMFGGGMLATGRYGFAVLILGYCAGLLVGKASQ